MEEVREVKSIANNFLLMIQFLTRININKNLDCREENFKWGAVFMPVIGFLIGGIQWIAYKILINVLPVNVCVVIVLLIGIMLTGAMHIDGLGDMCDGFFAFKGKDKIIEIMKDSRVGTYSCIAVVLDLIFKYGLLCFIVPRFSMAIISAPVLSRLSTVFIVTIGKTAKDTGTGNLFIGTVKLPQFLISIVITAVILLFVLRINPLYSGILTLSSIITSYIFNLYCNKKINGLTGDLLGANNEIMEIFMFIIMAAIVNL